MAKLETAAIEEATREPKPASFFSAIGGSQFIAAQIFTILATILGVYLAGYVSFQRTLEYDRFVKAQQQANLLSAAREELKQNIARLRKFDERLPAEYGTGLAANEWPRLRLFVWGAVGRSSSAFDLPSGLLTGVQALYEDLGEMLNDSEARESFRSLTTSNTYFRTQYKERLNAQLKFAENSILPELEEAVARSGKLVKKYAAEDAH